jgi:hypothetical protein
VILVFAIRIAGKTLQSASALERCSADTAEPGEAAGDNYFPNTEILGANEMRVIALGTGTPNFRRSHA